MRKALLIVCAVLGTILFAASGVLQVAAKTGLLAAVVAEVASLEDTQQIQVGACLSELPTNSSGGTAGYVDLSFTDCTAPNAGWKIVGREAAVPDSAWSDPDYWPCFKHEPVASVYIIPDPLAGTSTVYCIIAKPMGATSW